ncbi:peptidyl-tRNA hydrolase [Pseudonocardia oroxyli]|uniref:Peptidyl-tRNA hydrolase n=1 Tax=Pseudonocardia oroxyli TaxID=366584 RepID=A0A1G8DCV0_PSEOR|nr:peptidyl-tRNA hydrolase [Pseudonocardia oroxyli]SDH55404.1 Peptidyl-tRNA hydrolase [Pseudonocardia oroxyli]
MSAPSPEEGAGEPRPSILEALAARYGRAPVEIPPEADGVVRAMPVILRIERDPLPGRTALLEAAAQAALAVCVEPEPEWEEPLRRWVDGRIRKIARRARGAHWAAVQELPGVTVEVDGAQARALLPGPVDDVPKTVSRLQIGGTELPPDDPGPAGSPIIVLNPAVDMTLGKAAAQVGHASMILAAVRGWTTAPRFHVRRDPALWAEPAGTGVEVRDAGFTEVDPGTVTCRAW